MDINQLVGRHVQIVGADPDLFGSRVEALVLAIDAPSQSLLVEFKAPAQIGEKAYQFAVASPRLQRDNLGVLLGSGTLGCGITCIPHDRYNAARPFDLSWWRGGAAGIADVVL
jgi:hypothetical protein